MAVLIVILIYSLAGFIEIFPMIKKKQKKRLILYSIFFIISFLISILLSIGIEISSPAVFIERIVVLFKK
ncbi:hypothetical protein [Caloranaerobacter azorensis]|uniref:Uncharacterized protein n=1 Tax=Caloranaerobacter azorensis TaxID=116090 RepID=A0A6P1YFM3_9FIRM|nr:hypothetical protein [Caloranaerobacter azorensis]QIB26975.1 hypothetical protein G3A45_06520 [Caloranaerobacter azorensis]